MSINLTDEIEVKTKKGKLGAAKQIFLEGDTQTVEKEIQDINSRHNTLNTKHESLSRTVQGISATGGASTANNVTYNNDSSGLNAENAQDAIDELQDSKVDKTSILQELGDAENSVMSQKATTTAIADETTRAKAAENKFLPLISEDVCKLENYKTVCTGISPMTYSDSAFGNLGDSFTILIKFNPSSPQSQAGFKNTLISKGDYDTDGWAIKTKEDDNIGKLYLCVNGVYYPIYDNILHTISNYNIEIAIVSGKTTRVYLYGKEVITLDNVATHSSSALTVGGNSDRYYFNYLIYLSFSYYERDRLSIMNEFSLLYRDFIRKSIEATFVASPLSLNDYGYSTGERFALVSSRKIITKTFNMLYVPQGYTYGMQLFDGFRHIKLENFNFIINEVPNAFSDVSVFSKIFDVSEYDGIEIHNLSVPKVAVACIVFLSEDNTIINYVYNSCVKPTLEGTYNGYVDSYSVDFPIGTKKICMLIRYNTYFKLYKNSKIVEAKELTAKNHRIYDRTPIILFDSARLINGTFIAYYNADSKWMPVTKNGETLTIDSELLTGFGLYKVCNAVYKDSEDNLGIIHVFKDNSGVLNILDPEDCPDNIAAITTHAYGGSGEMHLSSNASKAVGQALADATNDTLNYLVGGIAGYAQCKSYRLKNPNSYSLNNYYIVTDPVGNAVFSTYHANRVYAGMYMSGAWGINQNQYNTTYKSDAEGVIASFSHIARYRRGYYEISAVTPRYSTFNNITQLTTAKVVCTVKNNGKIIDSFEISDWRADRRCVFIDERNTSEYILNVNKLAGDINYSLQSAINAAIGRITTETILVFKQNNEYVCYVYNGDNNDTDAYKDIKCWSLFEWGKVEIIFKQEGEGISELYVNRILQVEESNRLRAYPITSDSYVAWLGDSWTYAADDNERGQGLFSPLLQYDFDNYENLGTEQPTENTTQCPLPRSVAEKTGCKMDLWGRGTKTSLWAWQYQVWRIIRMKKYTHIVIEYFSNDQSNTNDNVAEVMAMARVFQENGIIPIIFGPTTAARSSWYNEYRITY